MHVLGVDLVRTTEGTCIHINDQSMFLRFCYAIMTLTRIITTSRLHNELRDLPVRGTTFDHGTLGIHELQV